MCGERGDELPTGNSPWHSTRGSFTDPSPFPESGWGRSPGQGGAVTADCQTSWTEALNIPALCVTVTIPPDSRAILFHSVTETHASWFAEDKPPQQAII